LDFDWHAGSRRVEEEVGESWAEPLAPHEAVDSVALVVQWGQVAGDRGHEEARVRDVGCFAVSQAILVEANSYDLMLLADFDSIPVRPILAAGISHGFDLPQSTDVAVLGAP
jgi:hypothetical protein